MLPDTFHAFGYAMPPERHPLNLLDSYPPGSRHRRGHPVYRRLLSFAPRPRVSNDNAHAEALFRTAKYHPTLLPEGFADLESARQSTCSFVHTSNDYHRHRALRFVTPAEKHSGEDKAIPPPRARNSTRTPGTTDPTVGSAKLPATGPLSPLPPSSPAIPKPSTPLKKSA